MNSLFPIYLSISGPLESCSFREAITLYHAITQTSNLPSLIDLSMAFLRQLIMPSRSKPPFVAKIILYKASAWQQPKDGDWGSKSAPEILILAVKCAAGLENPPI
jgi:hypothetical protein